jgi:tRNA A-37 threonylcarbamoyl transferase component Bud32
MVGPYRLERVLGTGSFATVWLAYDDVLDRKVAVKILADNWSRDNDVRRRFLAEARVLLTVESPRIVRGFHLGESPAGQPYLVMAYADRGTLGDRIDQRRREGRTFDAHETVGIATEVAYALADVHASGHLHRDVKPTNVLIRSSSTRRNIAGLAADETVVLGDFGLARGLDLSALTLVAGSPGYVAPEQAAGLTQLDRRADLYPLGRMMLEMLVGDPGGRATTMAGAATEQIDVAALLAEADHRGAAAPNAELVELITRLVAKEPDQRPRSADEVVATLDEIHGAAVSGSGQRRAPPSGPPPAPPVTDPSAAGDRALTGTQLAAVPRRGSRGPPPRRPLIAAVAALLLVAIVAIVFALTRDGGDGGGVDGTTTTAAILVPDSTAAAETSTPDDSAVALVTEPQGRPISTAPASAPVVTEAAVTTSPTSSPDSSTATNDATSSRLVLPRGAFTPELLGTAPADSDRQEGNILMSADQFASAIVGANPEWAGELPEAGPEGTLDFELTGFGRTAAVHIEPAGQTSGAVIVSFVIEYS